jgi:DNA-binding MarR family transcriptional regulator
LLAQAGRGVARELDRAFAALPVTPIQYTVLSILDARGALSNAELSRRFFVTAQTMNETVSALTRAEYVSRTEDPRNRRILRTSLTPAGRAVLRRCDKFVEAVELSLLARMSEEEVDLMRQLMRKLLAHVRDRAVAPEAARTRELD